MKKIVFGIILISLAQPVWAATQNSANKNTQIAVITAVSASDFEAQVLPFFQEQLKRCNKCEVKNITPYKPDGSLDLGQFPAVISQAKSSVSFLYLHWNARFNEDTKPVVESLKAAVAEGFVVIGAAGMAAAQEPTLALNKTVLGNVPGLVIIGDLEGRERLPQKSFFGPEMLTAIKAPDEYFGKNLGSAIFAGRLATDFGRRSSGRDWMNHFQYTKSKTRQIWPRIEEFFGR